MRNFKLPAAALLWLFLAAAIGFSKGAGTVPGKGGAGPQRVTVLFFNDLHGNLLPVKVTQNGQVREVGGIARMATLVKKTREENEPKGAKTILLVAGDILQGTPLSTVFRGRPDVECLNKMGVAAMTVGNHEFDFGLDNFLALKKLAHFPFVSSNIVWKDTRQLVCDPFLTIKLSDNISLTVIGATTRELLTTTQPGNVEKLDVLDSVDTVKKYYDQVKSEGPVILLSHSRFQTDSAIAAAAPGLLAIVGGHDQLLFNPRRQVGPVPVFQAFEKGKFLGRLDLEIDPKTKQARIANWTYLPVTADVPADPEVSKIVETYNSQLDAKFKEVIGENQVFLDGERERIRYEETNLGDFIADIMREFTGADAALLNAGSIRASLDAGPITVEAVFKVMPYENELLIVELTGEEIMKALTRSVQGTRADEDGGFLHGSGLSFQILGKSVANVVIGPEKKPLELKTTYKVAITDFMAAGGDGYDVFKGKAYVDTGLPLRELIVETIRQKKLISAKTDGRMQRLEE